jgi:hypothetical protein
MPNGELELELMQTQMAQKPMLRVSTATVLYSTNVQYESQAQKLSWAGIRFVAKRMFAE